jgi:hypothetical protein
MHKIINNPVIKYGVLAGVILALLKVVIYVSGNTHLRFEGAYTFGSSAVIIISLVMCMISIGKQDRVVPYSTFLLNGFLVILIGLFLSGLTDQISFAVKPSLPSEIKEVTMLKMDEVQDVMKDNDAIAKPIEEFKKSNPKEMVGLPALLQFVANTALLNIIWVFAIALIFWIQSRKKIRAV